MIEAYTCDQIHAHIKIFSPHFVLIKDNVFIEDKLQKHAVRNNPGSKENIQKKHPHRPPIRRISMNLQQIESQARANKKSTQKKPRKP